METLHPCENDALQVDDLLDFSCGDIGGLCEEGDGCVTSVCGEENNRTYFDVSAVNPILVRPSSTLESSESLYSTAEDDQQWEWLSTFMEDSYRGADQSIPLVSSEEQWFSKTSSRKEVGESSLWRRPSTTSWLRMSKSGSFCQILDVGSSPLIELSPKESMKSCAVWDKRGRSKRSSRSGGRVWSLQTAIMLKKTAAEEAEEEEEHSQASSLDYEPFYFEPEQPAPKKLKKERGGGANEEGRRCTHCQVQKTPQWRAGPLGPKTLCNACGVRYKSGRLLPEYRPAASPTFVTEVHSNSHKKVLEMRNGKSRIAPRYHEDLHLQDQQEFSTCSQESVSSLHQ